MPSYEHSVTVTDPRGQVLLRVGGDCQLPEGLSAEQVREEIKASVIRDLTWDVQVFRTS